MNVKFEGVEEAGQLLAGSNGFGEDLEAGRDGFGGEEEGEIGG